MLISHFAMKTNPKKRRSNASSNRERNLGLPNLDSALESNVEFSSKQISAHSTPTYASNTEDQSNPNPEIVASNPPKDQEIVPKFKNKPNPFSPNEKNCNQQEEDLKYHNFKFLAPIRHTIFNPDPKRSLFPLVQECPLNGNSFIKGPKEVTVGYVCWGNTTRILIPLINSTNHILSCSFNVVTAFMANEKVDPKTLDLTLPGNCHVLPRSTMESTITLMAATEGDIDIWIEILTTIPIFNTAVGSFTTHITMTVEYPRIKVETSNNQVSKRIQFDIINSDQEADLQIFKITNEGFAKVTLILFLQADNFEHFEFVFHEIKTELLNSNHGVRILSSKIVIFELSWAGKNELASPPVIHVPVTIRRKKSGDFKGCHTLKGVVNISLQCPNGMDKKLDTVALIANIGNSETLTANSSSKFIKAGVNNAVTKSADLKVDPSLYKLGEKPISLTTKNILAIKKNITQGTKKNQATKGAIVRKTKKYATVKSKVDTGLRRKL